MNALTSLIADQAGVVSRRQLLEHGLAPHDIRRLVRRRELARLHEGVYLEHTGEPTWHQRAWAAVLFSWPAALWGHSALRAARGPGHRESEESVVHVGVDRSRSGRVAPPGVRIHPVPRLTARAQWNTSPPRMRFEEAALDVASLAPTDLVAIGHLADACQSGRTTAARLRGFLNDRPRSARRALLDATLADVAAGTCSVLEHGYLDLVERPHGFPVANRQAAPSPRPASSTATPTTARSWSSWTDASSTAPPQPATATSSATSTPPSPGQRPFGCPTGRSSTAPAAQRPRCLTCCSPTGWTSHLDRAGRPAAWADHAQPELCSGSGPRRDPDPTHCVPMPLLDAPGG